jgi:hypothetical protein
MGGVDSGAPRLARPATQGANVEPIYPFDSIGRGSRLVPPRVWQKEGPRLVETPSAAPVCVGNTYLRTVTGVPTLTAAKKRFAFDPGIRIQPCEAG